jgi:hypothetical protein
VSPHVKSRENPVAAVVDPADWPRLPGGGSSDAGYRVHLCGPLGHETGSGFSDISRPALGVFASLDRF